MTRNDIKALKDRHCHACTLHFLSRDMSAVVLSTVWPRDAKEEAPRTDKAHVKERKSNAL